MEIWKEVKGYEGYYEISNFGRVKSLSRVVLMRDGVKGVRKEKFLKASENGFGYLRLILMVNKVSESKKIHQLVAEAFLNHTTCGHKSVVNHKDFNRSNNHVDNLEITNSRTNSNRKHIPHSSIYTGVSLAKNINKWNAKIQINRKNINLGYFINEYDAHLAYESALEKSKLLDENNIKH